MSLILYVKADRPFWENRNFLTSFPATIEATLTDGSRDVVCFAYGRPADANRDGVWVLMSGQFEAGYWHYQCNFVRVSRFRSYDLMIRISDVGPGTDRVMVIPTLKGGGTELP